MEEILRQHLLQLVTTFAEVTGTTPATVGKQAVGDNTVFKRLEARRGSFTIRIYERLVSWMADRWPAETPWPTDIPHPATLSKRIAA